MVKEPIFFPAGPVFKKCRIVRMFVILESYLMIVISFQEHVCTSQAMGDCPVAFFVCFGKSKY